MRKLETDKLKRLSLGYILILPALVMVVVVRLYPVINGTYLSLTDKSLFTFQKGNFIWFNNFFNLIFKDQEFHSVLGFTFAYTFFVVFLSYASGMMIALLLNKDIKYRGFFRTVMLIPWVIPPAVGTSNFLWILNDQFGVVNIFLKNIGFINKSINFLASETFLLCLNTDIGFAHDAEAFIPLGALNTGKTPELSEISG